MYEKFISKNEFYAVFSADNNKLKAEADFIFDYIPYKAALLDVGAADGSLACELANKGYRVVALEPDGGLRTLFQARLKRSPETIKHVDILPFPLEQWNDKEMFDAVVCYHVLPHLGGISMVEAFLSLLVNKVKEDGFLFLSFPLLTKVRKPTKETLLKTSQVGNVHYFHYSKLEQLDPERWLTTWRFVAERKGETLCEISDTFEYTPFSLNSVEEILQNQSMEIVGRFSGANGEAFYEKESTAAWLVLRKKSQRLQKQPRA